MLPEIAEIYLKHLTGTEKNPVTLYLAFPEDSLKAAKLSLL